VDRTVGWVVGATTAGGHLFHTTNEGRSWADEADTIAESTPLFFDVDALDRERAVAVGSENGFLHPSDFHRGPPVIVFTNDAGTAWQRSTLVGVDRDRFRDTELLSVCLTPSGHGIATGTDFTGCAGRTAGRPGSRACYARVGDVHARRCLRSSGLGGRKQGPRPKIGEDREPAEQLVAGERACLPAEAEGEADRPHGHAHPRGGR